MQKKVYRLFVSSPSDVVEERQAVSDVAAEINASPLAARLAFSLEVFRWELDATPGLSGSPQGEINAQTEPYDLYIGIIWKRMGTKSRNAASGTKEELIHALESAQSSGSPRILFYLRDSADVSISDFETDESLRQLREVIKFRKELAGQGILARYQSVDDFRSKLRKNLEAAISALVGPAASDLAATVPVRDLCQSFENAVRDFVKWYDAKKPLSDHVDLEAEDANGVRRGVLSDVVDRTIAAGSQSIIVLGAFGSGKTSFALRYAVAKARAWQADPESNRVPIVLRLNEFEQGLSMYEWILGQLSDRVGLRLSKDDFVRMQNEGKILLILDGLDEMAATPGEHTIKANLSQIKKLPKFRSPVIVTCRSTFFATDVEHSKLRRFEPIYVAELSDTQIQRFVAQSGNSQAASFMSALHKGPPDLLSIARRPLFLEMLVAIYKDNGLSEVQNLADLYSLMMQKWLRRESNRSKSTLSHDERTRIIRGLAFAMMSEERYAVHSDELPDLLEGILVGEELSLFLSAPDLCAEVAGAVLEPDRRGVLRFPHQSFVEYLVADKLASELRRGDATNLGHRILYEEIYEFLASILSGPDSSALVRALENPQSPPMARVCVIPPMRKQGNARAIPALLRAHVSDDNPLVRYAAGYTVSVLAADQGEAPAIDKSADALRQAYETETNSLVRLRTAILLQPSVDHEFQELRDDYDFDAASIEEIADHRRIVSAFARVLNVNREHEIMIEESMRFLALYLKHVDSEPALLEAVVHHARHAASQGTGRLRRIGSWVLERLAPGA